jgi:hypothetical protein
MSIVVILIGIVCAFFLILLFAGAIILQIHLSKKENRWLGLILPIVYFGTSTVVFLGLGFIVLSRVATATPSFGFPILIILCLFIVFNIPAIVLIIINRTIRAPRKNKKEINKMNIQDLS